MYGGHQFHIIFESKAITSKVHWFNLDHAAAEIVTRDIKKHQSHVSKSATQVKISEIMLKHYSLSK